MGVRCPGDGGVRVWCWAILYGDWQSVTNVTWRMDGGDGMVSPQRLNDELGGGVWFGDEIRIVPAMDWRRCGRGTVGRCPSASCGVALCCVMR